MKIAPRILLLVAILSVMGSSCSWWKSKEESPKLAVVDRSKAVQVAINRRDYGRHMTCSVSGREFYIDESSRAAVYHGRPHYFIDQDALEAFLKNPAEYEKDPPTFPPAPMPAN